MKNIEDSVFWLWQAHNKVNMRLKGDETEDPMHPKVQFPTDVQCPNCRVAMDDNNQWDLTNVFEFLLSHYSPEKIMVTDESKSSAALSLQPDAVDSPRLDNDYQNKDTIRKRDVRYYDREAEKLSKFDSSNFPKWVFGNVDISLCILLYISSVLLLLICYFYIFTRHKHLVRSLKRRMLHLIS